MTKHNTLTIQQLTTFMKQLRKKKGVTQVDLSSRLGISQATLSKMENGLAEPTALQWFEFCRLMQIRLDAPFKKA
jgi:transcriptional regulator with XRE-family HTH domain